MIEPSSIYVLYDWSKVVKTKTKIVSSSLCSKLVLTWHSQMHFSIGIRSYSYCLPWSLCDKNDIKILRLRPQRAKPHRSRELVLNATALPGHSDRKICFAEKKVLKLPTTADNLNVGPKFPHFVVPFFCWRFSFVVRLLSWFSKISQTCITVCRDVPPSQRVALGCLRCKMSHIWSFSVVANIH